MTSILILLCFSVIFLCFFITNYLPCLNMVVFYNLFDVNNSNTNFYYCLQVFIYDINIDIVMFFCYILFFLITNYLPY